MAYVLIIIFTAWDAGGTATQKFQTMESCEVAREWAQSQLGELNSGVPRVKAKCFKL